MIAIIQKLVEPQPSVYIKTLRKAYEEFSHNGALENLLEVARNLGSGGEPSASLQNNSSAPLETTSPLSREDLRLICFEYVWQ